MQALRVEVKFLDCGSSSAAGATRGAESGSVPSVQDSQDLEVAGQVAPAATKLLTLSVKVGVVVPPATLPIAGGAGVQAAAEALQR